MRGWNRNSQTWSYNERATATGDAYFNGYSHSYLKSSEDKKHFNALYIPLSLSLEFDIQRHAYLRNRILVPKVFIVQALSYDIIL